MISYNDGSYKEIIDAIGMKGDWWGGGLLQMRKREPAAGTNSDLRWREAGCV